MNFHYELQFLDFNLPQVVPCVSGFFIISPTKVLEDVNGFDPQFFMYLEDVDLSRRIGEKYSVMYTPTATVIHNFEKGSYKSFRLLKYHIISAIKYFNKWGWVFDKKRRLVNNEI